MERRTFTAKTICLIISFTLLLPFFGISAVADDYYEDVNEIYRFGSSPLYHDDFAETYVREYGDWNEGDPIPTDFEARTYVKGYSNFPGWNKQARVEVNFYDPGNALAGSDSDMVEISWYTGSTPTEGTAVVYGDGNVNEEYGLYEFTSFHQIYVHYVSGDYQETFPVSDRIIIDTTGLYR